MSARAFPAAGGFAWLRAAVRSPVLCIVGFAFVVRVAVIIWTLSGASVAPESFMSKRYFQEGYAVAAGWGYATGSERDYATLTPDQRRVEEGSGIAPVPRPRAFFGETLHPPGMAIVVAALARLFGGNAVLAFMLFGALFDTATAVVLFWMVRAAWSERVGFVTAVTYALFLPQAYAATASLSPDGIASFFTVSGFACILRGLRTVGGKQNLWFVLGGAIVGAGGYLRPDYDLLGAALFPFLWLYLRDGRAAGRVAALVLTATVVTLLPWGMRNERLYGRWIFTSTAVGSTMMEGLGEFRNPWGFKSTDVELTREARAHGFTSAWSPAGSDYFNAEFVAAVRRHPLAYVESMAKRLPLAIAPAFQFGYSNPSKLQSFSRARAGGSDRYDVLRSRPLYVLAAYWDALLFAAVSLVFAACSVAMLVFARERRALALLLFAPHVYGVAVHLVSELEPRYLLPSTFSLMIGFAYGLVALRDRTRIAE